MITKDTVAEILNIDEDDISDSVFTWAKKQFFLMTDLKETETQKTHTKYITRVTNLFKIPDTDIKSIDEIKIDGTPVDGLTEFTNYKYNPYTGLLWYGGGFGSVAHTLDGEPYSSKGISDGGFGSGNLVEIKYTINSYTHLDIHDYLVSLLVTKALGMFTPDKIHQIRMVKIGRFQKQLGGSSANLNDYNKILEAEIDRIIDAINGDDGKMTLGPIM
jgi:hypothetical protein